MFLNNILKRFIPLATQYLEIYGNVEGFVDYLTSKTLVNIEEKNNISSYFYTQILNIDTELSCYTKNDTLELDPNEYDKYMPYSKTYNTRSKLMLLLSLSEHLMKRDLDIILEGNKMNFQLLLSKLKQLPPKDCIKYTNKIIKENKDLLKDVFSLEHCQGTGNSFIISDNIVKCGFKLTQTEFNNIVKDSLKVSVSGVFSLTGAVHYPIESYISMHEVDKDLHCKMLQFCMRNKITYSELVKPMGVTIFNTHDLILDKGLAVRVYDNLVSFYCASEDEAKNITHTFSTKMLQEMLVSDIFKFINISDLFKLLYLTLKTDKEDKTNLKSLDVFGGN